MVTSAQATAITMRTVLSRGNVCCDHVPLHGACTRGTELIYSVHSIQSSLQEQLLYAQSCSMLHVPLLQDACLLHVALAAVLAVQ